MPSSSARLRGLTKTGADAFFAELARDAAALSSARGRFELRGAALAIRQTHDEEVCLVGPAGTGKSLGVWSYLHELCSTYPRIRVLVVRKTRASLIESGLVTFEEKVLPPSSSLLHGPQRTHRHAYTYPNGSTIVVGGLDKPTKLFSTDYDVVYIMEAIEATLADYESLLRSLRNGRLPWHQLITDTNPGAPTHWLKQRIDSGLTTALVSRHEDNPYLYRDGSWTEAGQKYRLRLQRMTGARKARLFHGLWSSAEGMVYEGFDESRHVIDRYPIPSTWARYRAIDFGYNNPFVCQWWAISPDGVLVLYREIYMTHRLVEDHAREIKRLSAGERFTATICDHDAEGRATLERYGIPTTPAVKEIQTGIQAVTAAMRIGAADEQPRILFFRDALHERDESLVETAAPLSTVQEIPAYVWAPGADGRPNKELPLDLNNHGCDAMRYMAMYMVSGGLLPRPSKLALIASKPIPESATRDGKKLPVKDSLGFRTLVAPKGGKRGR